MEFTKKELYEIRQRFDIHSGQTAHGLAIIAERLKGVKSAEKILDKLVEEVTDDYDMYRTISAKAARMQEGKNDKKR